MIGRTISRYKILAKLSEDGTGFLYRAVDTEGDRPVAIRVLATANGDIRTREHRAKAASALQHPNIVAVYEFARADDVDFVVLGAPEGESVYDLLERERPHRRHLLEFASQIASVLAACHGIGIIHGPLNPANIFISPKRQIKFYDIGLGVLEAPPNSDDAREAVFGHGAPYVSPEQVQGSAPDARSDIFSFGALLYHMTTGRAAFGGAMISDIWTEIVEAEPKPVAEITSRAPKGMDKLLDRCLQKNPQRRFQGFDAIEPLLREITDNYKQNPQQRVSYFRRNFGRMAKGAGIALAATAGIAAAIFWWQSAPAREPVIGTQLRQMTRNAGYDTEPAASADGNLLAYASDRNNDGNLDIWIQRANGSEARQITNDPADDREPAFSPDGAMIAFRSERDGGGVFVVPVKGGQTRLIAREGRRPRYSPDGRWIAYWVGPAGYAPDSERSYKCFIVPASGGQPQPVRPDFAACTYATWSPDSNRLLFLGGPAAGGNPDSLGWWVTTLDGRQVRDTGAGALFRKTGVLPPTKTAIPGNWQGNHVFFSIPAADEGNIWRATLDPSRLEITTTPVRVTSGQNMEIQPSGLGNGRVVFCRQVYNADIWGFPVSANDGKLTGAPKRWTRDPGIDVSPSLSADGSRLVFESNRTGHYEPWFLDLHGGKETRVAPARQDQLWPLVSPDASSVAYSEQRIGRFEQFITRLDTGSVKGLCEDCGAAVSGWSHDNKAVLINTLARDKTRLTVSLVKLGGGEKTLLLDDPRNDLDQASFSPDDRSIVFVVRLGGGVSRLYLTAYHSRAPLPSKEWIPITDGRSLDMAPQWSPDGKLIYFISSRDGNRCVWAQRLDAAKQPSGVAFLIVHFHTARRSPVRLPLGNTDLFVGRDQMLVSLGDLIGNIYSVKVPD